MRSLRQLFVRACAVSFTVLGAFAVSGPGCVVVDLIGASKDCNASCETLKKCGLLSTGDCGVYCAGVVSGAVAANCDSQLEAQITCAKAHPECTGSAATTCATQASAFAACMTSYCKDHPTAQGCTGAAGDAGTGDGG